MKQLLLILGCESVCATGFASTDGQRAGTPVFANRIPIVRAGLYGQPNTPDTPIIPQLATPEAPEPQSYVCVILGALVVLTIGRRGRRLV
jgi:hypothetical protein